MEVSQQTDFPIDRMGDGSAVVGIGLAVTGTEGEYLFACLPFQSQVIVNAAYVGFFFSVVMSSSAFWFPPDSLSAGFRRLNCCARRGWNPMSAAFRVSNSSLYYGCR